MIWQNPWAWLGLAAIGVPLLLHLLGRRRPTPLPFPTLRFIHDARPAPARRHRLNDIPLLLVRIAVIIAAVAALAQPLLVSRARAATDGLARVVLVDTSDSMRAITPAGRPAIDVARDRAQTMLGGATVSRTIDAADLRTGLVSASTWLGRTGGAREIVVISDFQRGALDDAAIRAVGTDVGLRFEMIQTTPPAEMTMPAQRWGSQDLEAHATVTREGTTGRWQATPASRANTADAAVVRVLPLPETNPDVGASVDAARTEALPAARQFPVTIVFPSAPERAAFVAGARPIDQPWMFDVIDTLRRDPALVALARADAPVDGIVAVAPGLATSVLRFADDRVALAATAATIDNTPQLVLLPTFTAGRVLAAALVLASTRAAGIAPPASELEPARIPATTLEAWTRVPSPTRAPAARDGSQSDGRWAWVACLILLGVETWMRRRTRNDRATTTTASEAQHARVA